MRGANFAARDQTPIGARNRDLAGLAARLMNAVVERGVARTGRELRP